MKVHRGFDETLEGLRGGAFSALSPLFFPDPRTPAAPAQILAWHGEGRFDPHPVELAEALSCACFLGATDVAARLLESGVDPTAGAGTGMDVLHWAVNRGQLETVKLLLKWRAPLEVRNMHGTTVLGTALWSARNEPRPSHALIIERLREAGAREDS